MLMLGGQLQRSSVSSAALACCLRSAKECSRLLALQSPSFVLQSSSGLPCWLPGPAAPLCCAQVFLLLQWTASSKLFYIEC